MGGKRLYTVSAVLGLGTLLTSCAADTNEPDLSGPKVVEGDWGDPDKYPEFGGAYSNLTAANLSSCIFTAKTGALVIEIDNAAAQTVVVAKRAADSLLIINGADKACTDSITTLATTVSTKALKTINVTEEAGGTSVQNLVFDFLAGTFAPGAKGKAGITVDLLGGSDTLAVRGTSGKDAFAAGDTGITTGAKAFATNGDAFLDIDFANTEKLTVSLAGGDDVFTGAGGSGTGDPYDVALTVFGGAGKDNLTGGEVADSVYGGADDDTVTGGLGNDIINGDDGDDTVTQGAAPDGSDIIICGAGYKDKVSYSLRGDTGAGNTEQVKVTVGTPWTDVGDTATNDPNDPATADAPFLKNDGDVATSEADDVGTTCEILVGGMDDDTLIGDDSTTKGHATDANFMGDTIYGGPGNDTLSGGLGNDYLYGEAGDDTFDETKQGDADFDAVLDIVYNSQGSTGSDTFVGGDGTDLVDYKLRNANLTAVMDGDPKSVLTVLPLTTTSKNDGETSEFDNVCTDVEKIYGGNGDDKLTGNIANNTLRGGPGNDELYGLAGDDTFDERTGWDPSTLAAAVAVASDTTLGSGNDKMGGGEGVDHVDYSLRTVAVDVDMVGTTAAPDNDDGASGVETDDVFADVENITGGVAANTIVGNDLDNVIIGGAAADSLSGGAGNDTIDGKGDDDTLLDGGDGDDTIDGGGAQVAGLTTCGAGDDVAWNSVIADGDVSCEISF
jgi:Ca2+-binding RTX toxin-like protein